jgi:hypothetical protein
MPSRGLFLSWGILTKKPSPQAQFPAQPLATKMLDNGSLAFNLFCERFCSGSILCRC